MKKWLYLDTSKFLVFGILAENFKWIHYNQVETVRTSDHLHSEIHEIFKQLNIKPLDLAGVIICCGPGSYTGIRVARGVADIFKWQGTPVYSFYSFDIPYYAGVDKGMWVSSAYKGQFFVHHWDQKSSDSNLVSNSEFERLISCENEHVYSHFMDESFASKESSLLVKTDSESIFSKIIDFGSKDLEPYYFRPLEEEFSVKKK